MIRRIAVCDDQQDILRQMSLYINQIQCESNDEFEIFYFISGEELLEHMPRDVEVILLDIRMNDISGMDVARKLRLEGLDVTIIFITSMTEYAIEGYEVHAFSFLCKPIQYVALRRHLYEAFDRIDKGRGATLMIRDGISSEVIDLKNLLYVEVLQHKTSFVFDGDLKSYKITLSEIEKQTAHHGFLRCHKSFLVNFRHIHRIDFSYITMSNKTQVPISKYRRKDFLIAYSRLMGVRL